MASPIYGRLLQIVKPLGLRFFAPPSRGWGKDGGSDYSRSYFGSETPLFLDGCGVGGVKGLLQV